MNKCDIAMAMSTLLTNVPACAAEQSPSYYGANRGERKCAFDPAAERPHILLFRQRSGTDRTMVYWPAAAVRRFSRSIDTYGAPSGAGSSGRSAWMSSSIPVT